MNLVCPNCRHEQDVPEPKPGQGVQCPACFKVFVPFPNPAPPAAPPTPPPVQPIPQPSFAPISSDLEHLRLLRIFHLVAGGLLGFGSSCFGIIYIIVGIVFVVSPPFDGRGNGPPPFFGWIFITVGLVALLVGWTIATFMFLGGRFLGRRTHHTFCFAVAVISCLFTPVGTVLGVFTIIVLSRASVKLLFKETQESLERKA